MRLLCTADVLASEFGHSNKGDFAIDRLYIEPKKIMKQKTMDHLRGAQPKHEC